MTFPNSEVPMDWSVFQDWLKDTLTRETAIVTFTKKDGNVRVMTCTLNPALLPPVVVKEGAEEKPPRKKSEDTMAVYDVTAQGWRSFTLASIKTVEVKR